MNHPLHSAMDTPPGYPDTLDYLYGLQRVGIKFGLTNISRLLEELGRPQAAFKTIHVAGTNGKGSTSSFIAHILQAAGYRVGLYTSPHLIDLCERIRINHENMPQAQVVALVDKIRRVMSGIDSFSAPLTFFEVVTALAFCYFAQAGVEVAVIETGMGGRLDATNVITPLISVITNIGFDHEQFLGYTLEDICLQKAGIIKPGVPLVTGVSQPELVAILEDAAAGLQSRVDYLSAAAWQLKERGPEGQNFDLTTPRQQYAGLNIKLLGEYQLSNAALAVLAAQAADAAGLKIDETAIRRGLSEAVWPGRLQVVDTRPYLVLDGAHNSPAARLLAGNLRKYFNFKKLILVIGILQDKNQPGILEPLTAMADTVILSRPDSPRAAEPDALKSHLTAEKARAVLIEQPLARAIEQARRLAEPEDLICVTGSLYTVGEVLAVLGGKPDERRISLQ